MFFSPLKAKRRRRVTWAPGKINQENVDYFEDFEKTTLTTTKKMKMSLSSLPEAEECKYHFFCAENSVKQR